MKLLVNVILLFCILRSGCSTEILTELHRSLRSPPSATHATMKEDSPDPEITSVGRYIIQNVGTTVRMKCNVKNLSPYQRIWVKEGSSDEILFAGETPMTGSERMTLSSQSELVIRRLQVHDSGNYTCRVSLTKPRDPEITYELEASVSRDLPEGPSVDMVATRVVPKDGMVLLQLDPSNREVWLWKSETPLVKAVVLQGNTADFRVQDEGIGIGDKVLIHEGCGPKIRTEGVPVYCLYPKSEIFAKWTDA